MDVPSSSFMKDLGGRVRLLAQGDVSINSKDFQFPAISGNIYKTFVI